MDKIIICYYNLGEKYSCGGFSKQEMVNIENICNKFINWHFTI